MSPGPWLGSSVYSSSLLLLGGLWRRSPLTLHGTQRMQPETFEHHATVHDYAERNGLAYLWEGTAAFENRRRTLGPEQYQVLAVHTRKGITHVIMFSKDIFKAELTMQSRASARERGRSGRRE